jgi:hypothetical protein
MKERSPGFPSVSGRLDMLLTVTVLAGRELTVTVPIIAAPTVTVTFSKALRLLESNATVTVFATVTVLTITLATTGALNVTTAGVSVICR